MSILFNFWESITREGVSVEERTPIQNGRLPDNYEVLDYISKQLNILKAQADIVDFRDLILGKSRMA